MSLLEPYDTFMLQPVLAVTAACGPCRAVVYPGWWTRGCARGYIWTSRTGTRAILLI